MSQIAGILSLQGRAPTPEERELQLVPLRRAPHDREGAWAQGPMALAQLALDITDEDKLERQPLVHGPTGSCLVWDGRLDNREDLFQSLPEMRRDKLAGTTDGELALHTWLRWGRGSPRHLVGDFAFAVWDGQRRELFLARDRMGMRPVYYAATPDTFAFASQIKGVRDLPSVDLGLDEDWVADYLSLTHLSATNTAYLGIRRLPAAHWMAVSPSGKVTIERYWRLRDEPNIRFKTNQEYYDHLLEVTRRAVHDRIRGSGPIGSMLSGGLDSSIVTAFACQKAREEKRHVLAASSVLPKNHPGPETDEREYVSGFMEMYPECEWVQVTAPGKHFLSDLDLLLETFDQPVRDIFHYRMEAVVRAASSRGVRTLLTGMGGDFFISSGAPGVYARLMVELRWKTLLKLIAMERAKNPKLTFHVLARQAFMKPLLLYSPLGRMVVNINRGRNPRTDSVASAEFAAKAGFAEREFEAARLIQYSPWRTYCDQDEQLANSGPVVLPLEYFAGLGTALGTVLQAPLFDARVIAAVAALPVALRRSVISRTPIRAVSKGLIPETTRMRRTKGPFCPDATRRARQAVEQLDVGGLRAATKYVLPERVLEVARQIRPVGVGWDQDSSQMLKVLTAFLLAKHVASPPSGTT